LPLDGGQLLRIPLEAAFGIKGFKLTLLIGALVALAISLVFFVLRGFLVGAIFFLFAFQSFLAWKKAKFLSSPDRKEENTGKLQEAEKLLQEGKMKEAQDLFLQIRKTTKRGIIFAAATHYLSQIDFKEGKTHEAYELLLSVKDQLTEDALCFLQKLAFEEANYALVVDLSSQCYQRYPSQEIALRNAKAFASLKQPQPAGGWLRSAIQFGQLDLAKVIEEDFFDPVRNDPEFQEFFEKD